VLAPLTVRSIPADPTSPLIPLSLAMLKDRNSPYYAVLDPDSGRITNAQQLGMLTTGVGTARTGLPISNHQLGFVPPADTIIVRQSGENTTGYAEDAFSLINRFQIREGRFKGLVFGLATVYQLGIRGYNYTDAADGGKRKLFYYPDQLLNNVFAVYSFKIAQRNRLSLQVNVANVLDEQEIVTLPRSTNGTTRYFAYQYAPRKTSFTATFSF
jgi:hypothetical protein